MEVVRLEIPDVLEIHPDVFEDDRGYFYETYHLAKFREMGIHLDFVQDNQSLSGRGVLRGLHFQNPPWEQGKLVRVVRGAVLDVAVDIRKGSPHYGKWVARELSEVNKYLLWIPPGFAHGFLTLADQTIFSYKCTNYYNRQSEGVVFWDDPDLAIRWGFQNPLVSERDARAVKFRDFCSEFTFY